MPRTSACKALLVFPRFAGTSFWNYRATCDLMGARYPAAPLGLITVAAMLPRSWELRLVDRNARELRDEDLAWADVVLTGGMLPQRRDTLHLIDRSHASGKPVVVGGPDATCEPEAYATADFRVLGEVEDIISDFLAAWSDGAVKGTFVAEQFPDLARSPVPRFDLLRLGDYLHIGVQFSRGCPFSCEFCNVIELNGRAPRTKTPEQVLGELEALRALGYRGHVDFVDDNLIGSRKAARQFLPELAAWVRKRHWPFEFSTEASLDLADDPELLALLRNANFFAVFVGIETPDPVALRASQKRQNVGRNVAESVRAIHRAGLFVNAGFIVGFDAERGSIATSLADCIEEAGIPICMVGLLYALPGTQLARRLESEGRLAARVHEYGAEEADQCTSGINFRPLRPRADVLRDYRDVLARIYAPEAYFGRARRAACTLDRRAHRIRPSLGNAARDLRAFLRLAWRQGVCDRGLRALWWRTLLGCFAQNPRGLKILLSFSALYLHLGPYSREAVARLDREIAAAQSEVMTTATAMPERLTVA
jgi:radical SAM superfamily enzyme YgiQ (UPF0313 family)